MPVEVEACFYETAATAERQAVTAVGGAALTAQRPPGMWQDASIMSMFWKKGKRRKQVRKQMSMQLTLVVLCVLLTCAHGRGTVLTTMEIEEKLGVCWSNELVHADVRVSDASLYDPAVIKVTRGKGVAMPCQVSDLERNGDGSIASCKVWFYVDLDAGEKVVFAVERGKRAAVTAGRLRLDRGDGSVTISTANEVGRVGIRLPLGKKFYNTPVPATETSGPVEALLLPSGRETGQGRFEVPFKIRSVESEVIAEGPLFAEVRVRTVFDTGYWIFTARMEERRPVVFISEELDTGYSGQQMVSSMRRNLEKWQPVDRFYSLILGRDGGEGFKPTQMFYGARNSDAAFADILGTTILPQFSEIRSNWVAAPVHGSTIKVDKPGDIFYLTGFASVISQLGRLVRVVEPGGEAVGAIGLHTERWHNPLSIRIRVTPQRELALSLPLQTYEQEWLSDGYGRFSPNYTGKDLYAPPYLSKRSYALTLGRDENERERLLESLFALGASQAPSLDQVLAMTLDWDSGAEGVAAEQSSSAGVEALEILARRIEITRFAGD
ncbi:MAG: hypothetical protein GX230_02890, partial [Lentisphaerae bacterium]|nr:hypothetical protein [Lentisphaerota bacterium]